MDKKLLLDIFRIPAPSGQEDKMRMFIAEYLSIHRIPFETDDKGNVFGLNYQNAPVLNAHMDTVQDEDDVKLAHLVKIHGNILSGYGVIGADDKCGIYVILELLKTERINFLFTVEEECGMGGIKHFLGKNSLVNYPYALTLDRYGSSDIVCSKNYYGTKDFDSALSEVGKKYGYKSTSGLRSDADHISDDISCANVSVGYYSHHTKKEYVRVDELDNATLFIQEVVNAVESSYGPPDKKDKYIYGYGYSGSTKRWYDEYDDEEWSYINKGYDKPASTSTAVEYEVDDIDDGTEWEKYNRCVVTKKRTKELFYVPSLDKMISIQGIRELLTDLEENGALDALDEANGRNVRDGIPF